MLEMEMRNDQLHFHLTLHLATYIILPGYFEVQCAVNCCCYWCLTKAGSQYEGKRTPGESCMNEFPEK